MSYDDNMKKLQQNGRIYLPELFKMVSSAKSVAERETLVRAFAAKGQEYDYLLRVFARAMWHPAIEFVLPEGTPPYTVNENPYGHAPNNLFRAIKTIGKFCKCPDFIESTPHRERFYIQTLEGLHKDEAELFIMIKDRTMDTKVYKGVTETLFRRVFPELLPEKAKKATASKNA